MMPYVGRRKSRASCTRETSKPPASRNAKKRTPRLSKRDMCATAPADYQDARARDDAGPEPSCDLARVPSADERTEPELDSE